MFSFVAKVLVVCRVEFFCILYKQWSAGFYLMFFGSISLSEKAFVHEVMLSISHHYLYFGSASRYSFVQIKSIKFSVTVSVNKIQFKSESRWWHSCLYFRAFLLGRFRPDRWSLYYQAEWDWPQSSLEREIQGEQVFIGLSQLWISSSRHMPKELHWFNFRWKVLDTNILSVRNLMYSNFY